MAGGTYVVICRLGKREREPGETAYTLATREVFPTREKASTYARTVAKSRRPVVVSGRWAELRIPK